MANPYVKFLHDNVFGLAAMQISLELMITFFWSGLILFDYTTPEGLQDRINRLRLGWLIDLPSKEWEEDWNWFLFVEKETMTLFSQGHAFAAAVTPVQIPFVLWSYPKLLRRYKARAAKKPKANAAPEGEVNAPPSKDLGLR